MADWGDTLVTFTGAFPGEAVGPGQGAYGLNSGSLAGTNSMWIGTTGGSRHGYDTTPMVDIFETTVDSTLPVDTTTTYYKLRGYYSAGATYEVWVSTDPDSSPPSSNTLDDIVIVSKWTV